MLPITKTISKEMLPLVDKPIIQVVIEELVEAGIDNIIIVTMPHKTDIADYFCSVQPELAALLEGNDAHKRALRAQLDGLQNIAHITSIEQQVFHSPSEQLCANVTSVRAARCAGNCLPGAD
ncbi:MAG: sugar phosphate nucleotidyltransferase [Candidatus Micrarchaeaceae archaeon]